MVRIGSWVFRGLALAALCGSAAESYALNGTWIVFERSGGHAPTLHAVYLDVQRTPQQGHFPFKHTISALPTNIWTLSTPLVPPHLLFGTPSDYFRLQGFATGTEVVRAPVGLPVKQTVSEAFTAFAPLTKREVLAWHDTTQRLAVFDAEARGPQVQWVTPLGFFGAPLYDVSVARVSATQVAVWGSRDSGSLRPAHGADVFSYELFLLETDGQGLLHSTHAATVHSVIAGRRPLLSSSGVFYLRDHGHVDYVSMAHQPLPGGENYTQHVEHGFSARRDTDNHAFLALEEAPPFATPVLWLRLNDDLSPWLLDGTRYAGPIATQFFAQDDLRALLGAQPNTMAPTRVALVGTSAPLSSIHATPWKFSGPARTAPQPASVPDVRKALEQLWLLAFQQKKMRTAAMSDPLSALDIAIVLAALPVESEWLSQRLSKLDGTTLTKFSLEFRAGAWTATSINAQVPLDDFVAALAAAATCGQLIP